MFKFIFIVTRGAGDIFDVTLRARNEKAALAKLRKATGRALDVKIREVDEITQKISQRRK
jgi:hypothetical protein